MSEFTLYIDGIEFGEYEHFNEAMIALNENSDYGSRLEIFTTYHIAGTGEKCKSERYYIRNNSEINDTGKAQERNIKLRRMEKVNSAAKMKLAKVKSNFIDAKNAVGYDEINKRIANLNSEYATLGSLRKRRKRIIEEQLNQLQKEKKEAAIKLRNLEAEYDATVANIEKERSSQLEAIK